MSQNNATITWPSLRKMWKSLHLKHAPNLDPYILTSIFVFGGPYRLCWQIAITWGQLIISQLYLPFQNDRTDQIQVTLSAGSVAVDHVELVSVLSHSFVPPLSQALFFSLSLALTEFWPLWCWHAMLWTSLGGWFLWWCLCSKLGT